VRRLGPCQKGETARRLTSIVLRINYLVYIYSASLRFPICKS
jgi:hypothetical protein